MDAINNLLLRDVQEDIDAPLADLSTEEYVSCSIWK